MVLTRNIFDDVKAAASFVLGERYTHPQANAVWAALRNIESGINIHNATTWLLDASALGFSGTPSLILVDEYLGNFVFFDDNAPTPGVRLFAFSGVDRTNTAILGLPTNAYPVVGAHDGAGVMVVGCTATGASTSKYARSANGAAWTVETSSTFTGSVPAALFYDPTSGLFISGLSGVGGAFIETSSDGNGPFTARTVPGALSSATWLSAASNEVGTSPILIMTQTSSDTYATSTDGVTWSTDTFPASGSYLVTFSSGANNGAGMWLAVDTGAGNAYTSTDGGSWSAATLPSAVSAVQSVNCMGDLFVLFADTTDVYYSTDGSIWTYATKLARNDNLVAQSDRRFAVWSSSNPGFTFTVGI